MVVRGELVANVVKQRSDNPVDISTVKASTSRRLQRVFEPSNLVTAERVVEPFQHSDQAIGQAAGMRPFKSVEHRVVSRRAVLHLRK